MKTADGKIEISAAAPEAVAFREVNPLVLPVAIFDGDEVVGDVFELQLVRGENPTIWVASDGTSSVIVSTIIWE